jgi:hypothetical protein
MLSFMAVFMALSTNEFLSPKKATSPPTQTNSTNSNKTWARILRGDVKTSSREVGPLTTTNPSTTSVTASSSNSQLSQFVNFSERPFLKGSVPDSVLIYITHVTDRLKFLIELSVACGGVLWMSFVETFTDISLRSRFHLHAKKLFVLTALPYLLSISLFEDIHLCLLMPISLRSALPNCQASMVEANSVCENFSGTCIPTCLNLAKLWIAALYVV